jgi:hypothetical protein
MGDLIGGVVIYYGTMKKPKTVKPFFFKDRSHQEMVDQLNSDSPINLQYNEDLVNRVYARYPLISKAEVAQVITAVFQSMRDLLILGKVLNFNNLFFDTKLHFFDYRKGGHILPSLKVKVSTPPPMRHHE